REVHGQHRRGWTYRTYRSAYRLWSDTGQPLSTAVEERPGRWHLCRLARRLRGNEPISRGKEDPPDCRSSLFIRGGRRRVPPPGERQPFRQGRHPRAVAACDFAANIGITSPALAPLSLREFTHHAL